jgi:hypothetical protein
MGTLVDLRTYREARQKALPVPSAALASQGCQSTLPSVGYGLLMGSLAVLATAWTVVEYSGWIWRCCFGE